MKPKNISSETWNKIWLAKANYLEVREANQNKPTVFTDGEYPKPCVHPRYGLINLYRCKETNKVFGAVVRGVGTSQGNIYMTDTQL